MPFEPKLRFDERTDRELAVPRIDVDREVGEMGYDEFPDDLAELATQLSADAAMLAERYPADEVRERPVPEAKPARFSPVWTRVAAALLVAAGATIGAVWQGGSSREPCGILTEYRQMPVSRPVELMDLFPIRAGTFEHNLQPLPAVFATEAVEHLNGEELELLGDALGEQLADI